MFWFATEIRAIYPPTGELVLFSGPNIQALTKKDAQQFCEDNGLGYCKVTDMLIREIPLNENGDPDYDNSVDYYDRLN